jgi:hypothetical protein
VPYTLDANDMRFATPQGFNSGDQFFAICATASMRSMPKAQAGRAEDDVDRACIAAWPGGPGGSWR